MAKITNYIPEPTPEYSRDNQQQVLQSLETMKNQLNFTFQEDLKQEVERVTWFSMRFGC
jgi:preprotein translocase subunit SecE